MDHRDRAQAVLAEFAASIGLERLALNEEDRACLIFGEEHKVFLDFADDVLALSCGLGTPAVARRDTLYALLLRANTLWRDLGVSFGLDGPTGEVVQLRLLPATDLDLPGFQAALGSYLAVLDDWARVVAGDTVVSAPPSQPRQPASQPVAFDSHLAMLRA